jgi:tRNA dimethylallyltransferase
MRGTFFIVGPTATGKSEIAADVAHNLNGEIVSADAFQIYRGLDLLSAKPDAATLAKASHHLIGTLPIHEEMNAEKFRRLAWRAIEEIHRRGKLAIIVGGSGLYIKTLTHGLTPVPMPDRQLRDELNHSSIGELRDRLVDLDAETARKIDMKNRRRLVRALEICLAGGRPASQQRSEWSAAEAAAATVLGVFVYRERDELYQRINKRVEEIFENGVIDEVRGVGAMSSTAGKMIGVREIRDLLEAKMSMPQCIAQIQQTTRRYAKRQLTWFRHQTSFEPLNLSPLTHSEAVKWISQRAHRSFATRG